MMKGLSNWLRAMAPESPSEANRMVLRGWAVEVDQARARIDTLTTANAAQAEEIAHLRAAKPRDRGGPDGWQHVRGGAGAMSCTCHTDIEKKIAEKHQAEHTDVIVTGASISGGAINFTTGKVVYGSSYAIETNVPTKAGGVRRKVVKGLMVFSHCPFCGVKQ